MSRAKIALRNSLCMDMHVLPELLALVGKFNGEGVHLKLIFSVV